MKYKLKYTRAAENDLNNIFDFIALDNLDKAVEFTELIKTEILKLIDFPLLGTKEKADPRLPNSRKYIIKNYISHYSVYKQNRQIIVTRILHGSVQNYTLL